MPKHSPVMAGSLSVVPGAGHIYLGRYWKAGALFVMDSGVVLALHAAKSVAAGSALFVFYYLLIGVPAVIECYHGAQNETSPLDRSQHYIIVLMLVRGCWALPMLWHSRHFSKRSKIIWSIVIPLIAAAYLTVLYVNRLAILNFLERWFDVSVVRGWLG